jgi:hypothetical protein
MPYLGFETSLGVQAIKAYASNYAATGPGTCEVDVKMDTAASSS